jgi:putative acetyltransferase
MVEMNHSQDYSMTHEHDLSFTIRMYEAEDLNDVLDAWESASLLAHPFLSKEFMDQERQDIPTVYMPIAETWVAECGGKAVGFIALIGNEVGAIFVQPAFHGKGIGLALMNKAQLLRGDLELEVFEENEIGRRFYDRYGFEYTGERMHAESGHKLLRMKFTARMIQHRNI